MHLFALPQLFCFPEVASSGIHLALGCVTARNGLPSLSYDTRRGPDTILGTSGTSVDGTSPPKESLIVQPDMPLLQFGTLQGCLEELLASHSCLRRNGGDPCGRSWSGSFMIAVTRGYKYMFFIITRYSTRFCHAWPS